MRPVGAGVYTIELARALGLDPNIRLSLIARRNDAARWQVIAPSAHVTSAVPNTRPLRLLWESRRGAALARSLNIEVWHGPHYTLPRGLPCASVVTIHDLTFFDEPQTHQRSKVVVFTRAIRRNARNATHVVCVSHHTADRLRAIVSRCAPITVAHHGVDHDRFHPRGASAVATHDAAILDRIGVRKPYIAFVGTLQPRKGLPTLIEAFALLRVDHPQLKLVLAGGDGWGLDALQEALRTHQVTTAVIRPGYIDDDTVAALYRNAAVVAYPSLAEGFGLPALEAMACGAPLVTTLGTAMDDFLADGAIAIAPNDAPALRDALVTALKEPSATDLRKRGPEIAAGFTWHASAAAHAAIYEAAALASGVKRRAT